MNIQLKCFDVKNPFAGFTAFNIDSGTKTIPVLLNIAKKKNTPVILYYLTKHVFQRTFRFRANRCRLFRYIKTIILYITVVLYKLGLFILSRIRREVTIRRRFLRYIIIIKPEVFFFLFFHPLPPHRPSTDNGDCFTPTRRSMVHCGGLYGCGKPESR